ncbi:MAG: proline dehydrogenase family protein [Bacteroidetes bacterium]|nr:proline dehydrogenase family protein [Bacteroidota bacterium]
MGVFRNALLWGSENQWMRKNVPSFGFVKRAVKRFMPGEQIHDAIEVTKHFNNLGIPATFTHLGENLSDISEARGVADHYLEVLELIKNKNIDAEISVKLTQLGFDQSAELTHKYLTEIASKAKEYNNTVFIDMEGSAYTEITIEFYKRVKEQFPNVGLCLQAYLYRTENDLKSLLPYKPLIRLVKGAYNEPPDIAMERKKEVDENYYNLSLMLLDAVKEGNARAAFATHDELLIERIRNYGTSIGIPQDKIEFQMLYGIKPAFQRKLATEGVKILVLISYGDAWFPWYMRRLAERPANVGFVIKNMFAK